MAITHVDSTSARATTDGDVTVAAPSGIADDDILLAWYLHTDNDAAPVTSTGFTALESGVEDATGQDTTAAMLFKIASSESGSYTLSGDSPPSPLTSNGVITCLSGINPSVQPDTAYSQGSHYLKQVDVAGVTNPSIVTTTDGAMVVLFIWAGGSAVTDFSAPSGYTKQEQLIGSASNMAIATKIVASASTETPGAWTVTDVGTTEEIVMFTVAVRPSVAVSSLLNVRRRT